MTAAIGNIASGYSLSYATSITWAAASKQSDSGRDVGLLSEGSNAGAGSTANATTTALADLRNQIESAVTTALDELDDSADARDILTAIRQAVTTTLQANGIQPPQGRGHNGHGCGGVPGLNQSGSYDGSDPTRQPTNDGALLLAFIGMESSNVNETGVQSSGGESSGGEVPDDAASSQQQSMLQFLFGSTSGGNEQNLLFALLQQNSATVDATAESTSVADADDSAVRNATPLDKVQELLETLLDATTGEIGINTTSLFAKLFAGFPNGTAIDAQA